MRPGRKKADGTGGQAAQALGHGCGGFGTEAHAAANPLGHPVRLHPTGAAAADKGSDADANRAAIRAQGAEARIPPRTDRTAAISYDRHPYRERNGIERFFGRIKPYRRVATRCGKKARNVLGFVWIASLDVLPA